MEQLTIIKIGGNIIDDEAALDSFLADFAAMPGFKLLVHGGGKLATRMSEKLGIATQLVDGRRITDADALQVITMVYAGWINKQLVAKLNKYGCPASGMCGADADLIRAEKREAGEVDFGFVGDVEVSSVSTMRLAQLLLFGLTPVIAPVTHDGKGQLLNTNADTVAAVLAAAMAEHFETQLIYCFEKDGVLSDPANDGSVIPGLQYDTFSQMKQNGSISKGMIPKLENAFAAKTRGVRRVRIMHARRLRQAAHTVQTEILS